MCEYGGLHKGGSLASRYPVVTVLWGQPLFPSLWIFPQDSWPPYALLIHSARVSCGNLASSLGPCSKSQNVCATFMAPPPFPSLVQCCPFRHQPEELVLLLLERECLGEKINWKVSQLPHEGLMAQLFVS